MNLSPAVDQSPEHKRRGGQVARLNPRGGLPPELLAARLPETYETAVAVLEECERLDQCQAWADQYEALASYARQAKDTRMRAYCDRIQARAVRRAGEILEAMPLVTGRPSKTRDVTVPTLTRESAAEAAGMGERQRKTAICVARVLKIRFEILVESEEPPTVTQLAAMGRQKKADSGMRRPEMQLASDVAGAVRRFSEFCGKTDPATAARLFTRDDVPQLKPYLQTIHRWVSAFAPALPRAS